MMTKPLDREIVKHYPNNHKYKIQYSMVSKNEEQVPFSGICFAGMPDVLNKTHYTGIIYKPLHATDQKEEWINFCKAHKILPSYIDATHSKFTIAITRTTPLSLIYTYLCALRHTQDEVGYIKVVLHMVDCGMDPFIALAAASAVTLYNSGHHFMNSSYDYGAERVRLYWAIALRRYLKNPKQYDHRSPWHSSAFDCHTHIGSACNTDKEILLASAFDEKHVAAVYSDSDSKAA